MDRWPTNTRRVGLLAAVLVLILMIIDLNARLEELNLLRKHAQIVSSQATGAVETQLALQTQVAYAGSDQAVQDWARGEGHYVQDGDQLVIPVGKPGATPSQDAAPTLAPTPISNWQIWWNLFFGE